MKITNSIKVISLALIAASAFSITGCGGSGGGGSAASPDGIYTGDIAGGQPLSNSDVQGGEKGIIYNGRLMVLSERSDGIAQLFDTNLTITNTSLDGNGFRYNNILLSNNITYNGTFIEKQSADIGFIKSSNLPANLPDGTFNLTASSTLLSKGSSNSRLEGVWTGGFASTFAGQMSLALDANGNIIAGDSSADTAGGTTCRFTGNIVAANTSINVYNATITSDGIAPCTMPAGDYTGLAWTEGDTNGTLVLMFADGTLKGGRAVILTKN